MTSAGPGEKSSGNPNSTNCWKRNALHNRQAQQEFLNPPSACVPCKFASCGHPLESFILSLLNMFEICFAVEDGTIQASVEPRRGDTYLKAVPVKAFCSRTRALANMHAARRWVYGQNIQDPDNPHNLRKYAPLGTGLVFVCLSLPAGQMASI